jgi:DNA-binding MarR family transcriptional regulator
LEREHEKAHEVLVAIRQIVRRISEHSKYLSREVGLTVPQLMCLKAIGEMEDDHKEITVAMVGERVQLSPATVSRIIDRLARGGLVSRERRSKDRRRVCLSLTPAGFERFQTLPVPLQERFVERFMLLPQPEQQGLLSALLRITQLMDAKDLDAAPMLAPGDDVKQDSSSS